MNRSIYLDQGDSERNRLFIWVAERQEYLLRQRGNLCLGQLMAGAANKEYLMITIKEGY
jgi:hypothetical protein